MSWLLPKNISLPHDFRGFDPITSLSQEGFSYYERHLPHWRLEGACYLVTFRLDDSLPKTVELEMRREAEMWRKRLNQVLAANHGQLPEEEIAAWNKFQQVQQRKLDRLLDDGHGKCLLAEPSHRQIIETALHHFEGRRCEMLAFTIMPNHVHVLCRPLGKHRLENLCGSWKWFTTRSIQHELRRSGGLWQKENFDRIIRDADHYATAVRYIAKNPIKAGLSTDKASVWFCETIRNANGWK